MSCENIKKEILLGSGYYHLWFLPMMLSLYLLTPFLKPFTKDKKKCCLFLAFYFVLEILLPTLLKFDFPCKVIVTIFYERFPNVLFTSYVGYYILGHTLHEFLPKLSGKALAGTAVCAGVFWALEVYACNYYSEQIGEMSTILNTPLAVNAFVASACIFILGKHWRGKESKALAGAARLTLGVYLLHPFVLEVFSNLGVNTLFAPAAIAVPAVTALVVLTTAALVFVLSKIPVVRKLL